MARSQRQGLGPLEPFEARFLERLRELGYTRASVRGQMTLVWDLDTWLTAEGLGVAELTSGVVARFVTVRRASGCRQHRTAASLVPLLCLLRELRVVPEATTPPVATSEEKVLDDYRFYLVRERGLATGTVRNYVEVARLFLSELADPDRKGRPDVGALTAGDVTRFVLDLARERGRAPGPRSAKNLQTAMTGLRSLLTFFFLEGSTPTLLVAAVPMAARWRASSLPKALDTSFVTALLESCDRTRAVGCRDFAVLTLLARLGLRIAEVAGLLLDDVDWRAGDFLVRGKAKREERLPLPHDVGEAIVGYLECGRPPSSSRHLFLRALAPHVEMTPGAVGMIVALACDRGGLARVGAHRLRHFAATEMLRHGSPLSEVGQVLRHRSPETTAIYAKVDRAALAAIARPWPGARS